METVPAQTVKVDIYNQSYNIRSNDGGTEYIQELAAFVDARMREIADVSMTSDSLKVAILTALHVSDELFKLRREHESMDQQVAQRAAQCTELLDQVLKSQ
ncbi:MAG: cell division protein ZapA [Blastocatellia bacterium]